LRSNRNQEIRKGVAVSSQHRENWTKEEQQEEEEEEEDFCSSGYYLKQNWVGARKDNFHAR
jgi:hypothetical protein